jgi:hypothetical protein
MFAKAPHMLVEGLDVKRVINYLFLTSDVLSSGRVTY